MKKVGQKTRVDPLEVFGSFDESDIIGAMFELSRPGCSQIDELLISVPYWIIIIMVMCNINNLVHVNLQSILVNRGTLLSQHSMDIRIENSNKVLLYLALILVISSIISPTLILYYP